MFDFYKEKKMNFKMLNSNKMNNPVLSYYLKVTSLLIIIFLMSFSALAEEVDVNLIMKKNDKALRYDDVTSVSTMTLINKKGKKRVRKIKGITKTDSTSNLSKRIVTFIYPRDVSGLGLLTVENKDDSDDIWLYMPALRKVKRIVSKEKKKNFAGTEFSYSDMTPPHYSEFNHKLLKNEVIDGVDCYVIESIAKKDSLKEEMGYSKIVAWIRKDNSVGIKRELYDLKGIYFKEMLAKDIKLIDKDKGKWMQHYLSMKNLKNGKSTIIEFGEVLVNQGIDDEIFTKRTLKKGIQ